jgi:putative membrane protein
VAAIEVCRPLPFAPGKRPSVRSIIKTALSGMIPGGTRGRDT